MELKQLFIEERFNGAGFFSHSTEKDSVYNSIVVKTNTFQEDIQRVIYSSAFRRLQNKTQVHPLPESDYMRSRLTHSLEVSEIGQIIAQGVASNLKLKKQLPDDIDVTMVKDIVAASCLIHDLGNPPFGHNGEEAIQSWFRSAKSLPVVKNAFLSQQTESDLCNFDGNAQTFRLITRLQGWREKGGLRLSAPVIAAAVKYPWSSQEAEQRYGNSKKFGFMKEDETAFRAIFDKLSLVKGEKYIRHPLSYVMEAADDIAYLTTDIEDGVKAGSIDYNKGRQLLLNCCDPVHRNESKKVPANRDDVIGYLRAAAISNMSEEVVVAVLTGNTWDSLVSGYLNGGLLSACNLKDAVADIRQECERNLYTRREKLLIEAGGHYIVEALLDIYMKMVNELWELNGRDVKLSKNSKNVFHLLPIEIQELMRLNHNSSGLTYRIVDYISGMTDTYAVSHYRKLTGFSLHRV